MQKLLELYQQWHGSEPAKVEKLPGAGSNRVYYRLYDQDGESVVGVIGTSRDEDHAFIYLCKHFTLRKLPVPHILACSDDELRYLQSDLGNLSLFEAIRGGREAGGRYTLKEQELLVKTIRELPNIQIRGARGLDFSNCYPQPEFDTNSVLFDLNYFKYCFLKATELDFHELKLEADFRMFAKDLTSETCDSFLYRDFQARNIMLDNQGNPYFIDFQGGRRGPYYYDLASFLWQASAKYSHKLRRELIYEYYHSLKNYTEVPSVHHFADRLSLFVLFRTLQVLGAYGFRGYFEHKKHIQIPSCTLLRLIENYTFKNASHINLISGGFKDYFKKYSKPQYSFYTNGMDQVFIDAGKQVSTNIEKPYIITYAGNLGSGQGLEKIIPEAAKALGKDYRFRIIGDGGTKSKLVECLKKLSVDNVELIKPIPRKDLINYYCQSTFLFFHLNDLDAFKK